MPNAPRYYHPPRQLWVPITDAQIAALRAIVGVAAKGNTLPEGELTQAVAFVGACGIAQDHANGEGPEDL